MKTLRHIVIALSLLALLGSCRNSARIIPRSTMTDIYVDMALCDAYLGITTSNSRMADTSRVYAAVFAKYGYTERDYLASQEKYIKDPGRYVRMIKKGVLKLDAEKRDLQARKKLLDAIQRKADAVLAFAPNCIYLMDSLDLNDTVWFDFDFQQGMDTCFAGPAMIVWADTLLTDTLKVDAAKEAAIEENKVENVAIQRNSIRTDKVEKAGNVFRDKPVASKRKDL